MNQNQDMCEEEVIEVNPSEEVIEVNPSEEVIEVNPSEEIEEVNPMDELTKALQPERDAAAKKQLLRQDEIVQQASNQYHPMGEDNLLHESLVDALESTCIGIDKVVLQKLVISKEDHKHSQLSSLICLNGKVHYLADYEDGNTLRVNIGTDNVGDEFNLVVVETVVANINNSEKATKDLLEEDITLVDFTKESNVKIGLHKDSLDDISLNSEDGNELENVSWEGQIGELLG
jgi:hypothetical protein